jgi:deoxyadenosine kinase
VWEGRGGVQDRTIYEDAIFAKMLRDDGLMEEREYQTYISLFNNMSNFMRKPNVIVYLDVTPEESYERIRARSRECESGLPLEYLRKLAVAYENFLEDISQVIPVLRVNWSQFHSAEEMAAQIQLEYKKMRSIRNIDWGVGPSATTPGHYTMAAKTKAAARAEAEGVASEESPMRAIGDLGAITLESPQ